MLHRIKRLSQLCFVALGIFSLIFVIVSVLFPLPELKPYSTVVLDRNGEFLHAFLASDGIWRFKTSPDEIPPRLKEILLHKEDRFFYYHPGVNPFSIGRALIQNIVTGQRTSGASTITMQVARMLEPKERTYFNKAWEMFRSLQLEWKYSKDEILELYLSLIPVGGNIEGLQSASVMYYQTPLERLNTAQLLDLILIPNDPNNLRPDRYPERLYKKRIAQARRLHTEGLLSTEDSVIIWTQQPAVVKKPLPRLAPHFALRVQRRYGTQSHILSSLDLKIQRSAEKLLKNHLQPWKSRGVQNGAVLVIDNITMEVVAYVGSDNFEDSLSSGQVDAVQAIRSPGSTLKPFLYAALMDKGVLTPKTRLLDVPYDAEGYVAENYEGTFSGHVYADEALTRSLNVPMVRLLKEYDTEPFIDFLVQAGISSLDWQRKKLGLSMIVGGCGVTLEELTTAFASFPQGGEFSPPSYQKRDEIPIAQRIFSSASAFMVSGILSSMKRPDLPNNIESAMYLPAVAFKTGTSYGRRDAWCIGFSAQYTVGVWIGNVTNQGAPDLVGSKSATPLLIDILNAISRSSRKPLVAMPPDINTRDVCINSGKLPGPFCDELIEDYYSITQTLNQVCTIDQEYLLSVDQQYLYCTSCVGNQRYRTRVYQNYPPELLNFFVRTGHSFAKAPPHYPECQRSFFGDGPKILSPTKDMMYLLTSQDQKISLQASSGIDVREHIWYVNNTFLARKKPGASLLLSFESGEHIITCVDDKGRSSKVQITVRHL